MNAYVCAISELTHIKVLICFMSVIFGMLDIGQAKSKIFFHQAQNILLSCIDALHVHITIVCFLALNNNFESTISKTNNKIINVCNNRFISHSNVRKMEMANHWHFTVVLFLYFYLLTKMHVVGTQKNPLIETILLSTQSECLC